MKKSIYTLMICLLIGFYPLAQEGGTPNIVGTNYSLHSEVLQEQRQVQVYLPPSYSMTNTDYPVLYLLDGQLFFNAAVSLQNKFKQAKLSPEFIIVGITTSYPDRFNHFSNERLLFGWEFGGSLGLHIMLNGDLSFNSYILASPFPIWDKIEDLKHTETLNGALYFSVSPDEYQVNHGTDKLDTWLFSNSISGLDWSYLELQSEEHHSTGYPTLYHGLRGHFKYYPEFQEDSFTKFIKAGGIAYAHEYNKKRAKEYGFSSELSSWSKFTIIRAAMRANDYGHFQMYSKTFVNDQFIEDIRFRALDIGEFYEKNENYVQAVEIYEKLLTIFPDSTPILKRTGNAYLSMDDADKAKTYFKRVKNISKKQKAGK